VTLALALEVQSTLRLTWPSSNYYNKFPFYLFIFGGGKIYIENCIAIKKKLDCDVGHHGK
jgi:hypothetical protein